MTVSTGKTPTTIGTSSIAWWTERSVRRMSRMSITTIGTRMLPTNQSLILFWMTMIKIYQKLMMNSFGSPGSQLLHWLTLNRKMKKMETDEGIFLWNDKDIAMSLLNNDDDHEGLEEDLILWDNPICINKLLGDEDEDDEDLTKLS